MQAVAEQRRKSKEKKEANKEKSLVVQKVGLCVTEGGCKREGQKRDQQYCSDLVGETCNPCPPPPSADHEELDAQEDDEEQEAEEAAAESRHQLINRIVPTG